MPFYLVYWLIGLTPGFPASLKVVSGSVHIICHKACADGSKTYAFLVEEVSISCKLLPSLWHGGSQPSKQLGHARDAWPPQVLQIYWHLGELAL